MSDKLEALAIAQGRVATAEDRVQLIRDLEDAIERGTLLVLRPGYSISPSSIVGKLAKPEVDVLTEALLITRRNAMQDVNNKKALVEGMFK